MQMASKKTIPERVSRVSDETKIKHAIDFIEELSWLLRSKRFNLEEIPSLLRTRLAKKTIDSDEKADRKNIERLTGILPRLFQDNSLFSKNEDIAEFALEVLGIAISRVEKRSKYELIGLIVCETNELGNLKLEQLVDALTKVSASKSKIRHIAKRKNLAGFSWNETIRELGKL